MRGVQLSRAPPSGCGGDDLGHISLFEFVILAYAVHSDIGDGYLHAVDARAGRRIGEDHELEEGDVTKIVSTAS